MPTISRAYHAHSGNYTPGGNSRQYIIVHYTGNSASAVNEAQYAQNNQHSSSYHYVLDGSGTIYQILNDSDTAWSVGAWSGATQLIRNNQSISIEVCNNGGPFSQAEIDELAWLVPQLMEKYGIPASRVVRHWDAHTGRKNCPYYYSGSSNQAWTNLHQYITSGEENEMQLSDKLNEDLLPDGSYNNVGNALNRARVNSDAIMNILKDIQARLDKLEHPWRLVGVDAPASGTVGQTIIYRPVILGDPSMLTYNYVWSWEGQWGDNWDSTIKRTGDFTVETSGSFVPKKTGTYYVWIDATDGQETITSIKVPVVIK